MALRPVLYLSTSGPCNRDLEKQKTLRGLALKRRSHIKNTGARPVSGDVQPGYRASTGAPRALGVAGAGASISRVCSSS